MDILALVSSLVDKKLGFKLLIVEEQSCQVSQNNVRGISLKIKETKGYRITSIRIIERK